MNKPTTNNRTMAKWTNLLYVAPAVVLFLLFSLFPLYRTFQYSFTNANGVNPHVHYIGLTNYIDGITDPEWWHAIGNGLFFAGMALVFMNTIALLLSVAVHSGIRGNKIYRLLFYIPPILSGIVVGYVWKWIYEPTGLLNNFLTSIGLASWKHSWIAETGTALSAVSVASMWQGVGGSFILFLAGLQGVPKDLYEAADMDGASRLQKLLHITIPSLRRVYTMVNILTILGAMEIFNQVYAMTLGGPGYTTEVPAIRIYREAFKNSNFGLASAFSVLFGAMLFIISYIQLKLSQRKE